jgi:succinoglycan biosynthesis transport protein ExoP
MITCAVAAAGLSYASTLRMPHVYEATTTVMVGQALQQVNPTSGDLYISQQLAETYAQMAVRQPILSGAAQALGLEYTPTADTVSTRLVASTQLLEISVRDTVPESAKALADEIANQLILQSPTGHEESERQTFVQQRLAELEANIQQTEDSIAEEQAKLEAANSARAIQQHQENITALQQRLSTYESTYASLLTSVQGGTNYISIIEPATLPSRPISPNVAQTVLLAAAIGLGLAVGGAVLIEFLDDTLKSSDEAARITQLPVLGTIARIEGESYADKLIVCQQPFSAVAEAYRALRTNIRFSFVDRPMRTLMVTSPGPLEGKSLTLANLAVAMAQAGVRVIMVDTDLRRPTLHKIFDVSNTEGLSSILLNPESEIESHLQDTGVENLRLLPCGPLPPNPAEVLGSERMEKVIETLLGEADLLLFDSPPVLVVTDAAVLAAKMKEGGVLLVANAGSTRRGMARQAVQKLQRVNAHLLGTIVNRLSVRKSAYYYSHYYTDRDEEKQKRPQYRTGLQRLLPRALRSRIGSALEAAGTSFGMPAAAGTRRQGLIMMAGAVVLLLMLLSGLMLLNRAGQQSQAAPPAATEIFLPPTATATATSTPTSQPTPTLMPGGSYYIVKEGDTLAGIAFLHDLTIDTLREVNMLASGTIIVGQLLIIPPAPTPTASPTLTPSPTYAPTATATPTRTPTRTPTVTPTLTPTATRIPVRRLTATPSPTLTPSPTPTVTETLPPPANPPPAPTNPPPPLPTNPPPPLPTNPPPRP